MPKKGLFLIFLFFFSNCGNQKNGEGNSQQTETKTDDVQFYKTLENFPIFHSEIKKITSVDKAKLKKELKSKEEIFKPFLTATNVAEKIRADIEQNPIKYKESFWRWLKSQTGENFSKVVASEYISKKFEKEQPSSNDKDNVRNYSLFLKAKLAEELNSLKKIEIFCDEIGNQSFLQQNRKTLVLAYILVAFKDFESEIGVLDRVIKNFNFCNVLSHEELVELIFLCLKPNIE